MLTDFVTDFLSSEHTKDISYAVMHHGDDLAQAVQSDIDIALGEDPRLRFIPRLRDFAEDSGFIVCQQLYYEVYRGYYIILVHEDMPHVFLHIDCLYDPYGISRYYIPTTTLLNGIEKTQKNIYQISDKNRILYLLIKRIIKRSVSSKNMDEFKNLTSKQINEILSDWQKLFESTYSHELRKLLESKSAEDASKIVKPIHDTLISQYNRRHPLRLASHIIVDSYRKVSRFICPTGFFIVILGPDGSGKSTVTEHLREQLDRGFRNTYQFHWRPNLLPKLSRSPSSEETTDEVDNTPAVKSKYGFMTSLIRFTYYWLDFVLGYWLKLYPTKARTTLIIGERYFADVLVHPARYGFSLPQWLMRIASKFVPKPDLTILLQDEPETIYKRKPELTVEMIAHQITEYEIEAKHWGKPVIVKTDKPADKVAEEISRSIIDACSDRTYRRLGWRKS